VNPLAGFVLEDEHGSAIALNDLWRERATALVFLRHYLCVQCRVGAMELERDRGLLGPEPNVWLLGMGTPAQARAFKEQTGVGFALLLSANLRAYEAMNLRRGSLWEVFGLAAQRVARRRARGIGLTRAAAGGNRPKKRPEQDWHQLGGAFVFAAGGRLVWAHRSQHAGDDTSARTLAEELRRAEGLQSASRTPTQIPVVGRKEV
jgi:peroxiredoxin